MGERKGERSRILNQFLSGGIYDRGRRKGLGISEKGHDEKGTQQGLENVNEKRRPKRKNRLIRNERGVLLQLKALKGKFLRNMFSTQPSDEPWGAGASRIRGKNGGKTSSYSNDSM